MVRKKLLIVNNNMHVGGVQKALISLLKVLHPAYDITLLLFYKDGPLLKEIPDGIKVIETTSHFRYIGMSQRDCMRFSDKIIRGLYAGLARILGVKHSLRLLERSVSRDKKRLEEYDAAISYLHNCSKRVFYGGTANYVLKLKNCGKRICYIHCDYRESGTSNEYNNAIYSQFDAISCVSESVKNQFLSIIPAMREKTYAMLNPVDDADIQKLSKLEPFEYDSNYINLLTVARLAREKGIERFVRVLAKVHSKKLRYYVIGEGASRKNLERMIQEYGLSDQVFLLGEDINPYRYMIGADFLVVPSFHEAAPVVFQEANVLGLPVLATRTLSADEMIGNNHGLVIENSEEAMQVLLTKLIEGTLPGKLRSDCRSHERVVCNGYYLRIYERMLSEIARD